MVTLKKKVFKNKDNLILSIHSNIFAITKKVEYIQVQYGEYNQGNYSGTSSKGCHYMASMGAYFPLNKLDEALEYFRLIEEYYSRDCQPRQDEFRAARNKYGYSLEEVKQMNLDYFGA